MKTTFSKRSNLGKLLLLCVSLFSLIYFVGCENLKDENALSANHVSMRFDNTTLETVNLISNEVKGNSFSSNKFKLSHTQADVSSKSAQFLLSRLQSYFGKYPFPTNEPIKYITTYTNGSMKDIELSEIKGISIFTLINGKLHHHFYSVNGQNVVEDQRFNVDTDYFHVAEMHLLGNAIFNNSSVKWTMLSVDLPGKKKFRSFSTVGQEDNLSNAITRVSGMRLEGEALLGCGSCSGGSGNCTTDHEGSWCCETCDEPLCEDEQINSKGEPLGLSLDLDIAYNVRDSFLKSSDVGKKYIDYYYIISKVAFEKNAITTENVSDHFNFATKVYTAAKIMQSGKNDEVVCNTAFKDQAIKLIEQYKTFSDDEQYQKALSAIETDVNKFVNRNKAYISNNWK